MFAVGSPKHVEKGLEAKGLGAIGECVQHLLHCIESVASNPCLAKCMLERVTAETVEGLKWEKCE
jgi:hypothetical protein